MHATIIALLGIAVSAGLFLGQGRSYETVFPVDLVFIPPQAPPEIAKTEPEPLPEPKTFSPLIPETLNIPEPKAPTPPKENVAHASKKPALQKRALKREQTKPQTASTPTVTLAPRQGIAPYNYRHSVVRHIEQHKYYPATARRRNLEGVVTISFSITETGAITQSRIIKTSGQHLLDNAALVTLKNANPLPPPPTQWPAGKRHFELPLHYQLKR